MNLSSENDFKRVQYIQELQKEFSPMTIEKVLLIFGFYRFYVLQMASM